MKQRVSVSIEADTAAWLTDQAAASAGGNLSQFIEQHFRAHRMAAAAAAEARFNRQHPDLDAYEQDERDALDAEIDRGSAA